ncbi:hypothetical protein ONJ45_28335, partial [Salmonella enterica subsp. enterica serovar Virginia]|nr:hypothetical protein [Salmonella enterica subsp. enterica serovar Virginia]
KSYISNQKNIIQHDDFFGRRLDIALCFDHGFIMPAGVAIYSINKLLLSSLDYRMYKFYTIKSE